MGQQHLTEQRFSSLELDERLLSALDKQEFDFCTPIQAQTLPLLLNRQRTCPARHRPAPAKRWPSCWPARSASCIPRRPATAPGKPRVLIMAPTRELAIQIHKDAEMLLSELPLKLAICYGGKAYEQQKRQFDEPVDILIGTPGRIIDFFKQHLYNLKSIEAMVLDEADRMFDMGFHRRRTLHVAAPATSRRSGSTCCSRRPWRKRSWNWPTST